jgi:hypothetical protein
MQSRKRRISIQPDQVLLNVNSGLQEDGVMLPRII